MSHSPLNYLRHILDETEYILSYSDDLDFQTFIQDETLKRAFVRSLEIIGEASKNVSAEFKQKYPNIEWRSMARMRDKLIHAYFGIDYEIVWEVIIKEIPKLNQAIKTILKKENTP